MYWKLVTDQVHEGDSILSGTADFIEDNELEFDNGLKVEISNDTKIDFE